MPLAIAFEFVLLGALWGSSFLFMRLGVAEFGPVATAGVRVMVGALCLAPLFLKPLVRQSFLQSPKPILFVGLLNAGIPFIFFAFAVLHIPTGLTAILNATVPLTGAVVAWLWLKDRPSWLRSLGLLIGFAGVCLLVLGKSGVDATGQFNATSYGLSLLAMAACIGATLCYGIAASFTRKYLPDIHPQAMAAGSQLGAALGLIVPMLVWWPQSTPSTQAWMALIAVGALSSGLAYVIFFKIMAVIGPSKSLTVTFLIPVFALIYGWIFLGEAITWWMVGCGVIILLGTALSMGLIGKRN